jgi:CheY-like chemotaxis protein
VFAEEQIDLGCSNVVDEALQHVFASTDLVLRIAPDRWLALAACRHESASPLIERAARHWKETLRHSPPGFLPSLRFEAGGCWELTGGSELPLEALETELARRSGRPSVLVADDDRRLCEELASQLIGLGYEVLTAGDGQAAIESAALFHPDAVVLDDRMPRLGGLEALSELRKRADTADVPVILHSEQPGSEQEARKRGAQDCLAKTGQPDALAAALRRWTADSQGTRES